ncbi:LacI family transcriptional regulator [Agromyces terreus]|uniref:LacI family transcriptional regulator n=1 Tax=Agromyces terreus TaxID=424795 RepID=A0A9X2GY71_9MICO|nr:LacI family DNA-binding transcriptional regulator [Agromyces terreus]MCP2369621.1 LacI family transcriptional regulator [Agromyces terreus]
MTDADPTAREGAAQTMQDVASSLGVSVSTVSLALRGNPVVSEATRARVQAEALRLGYVYNRSAANLRTKRRHLVGFVVPDVANPFVAESALGLQAAMSEGSQFVVLANTHEDLAVQTGIIRELAEERAAGLVLIPAIGTGPDELDALRATQMPAVIMNRHLPGDRFPYVGADDEAVVDIACDHLFGVHASRTVAYFGGIDDAVPHVLRRARFSSNVRAAGLVEAMEWGVPTRPNSDSAYEVASRLIAEGTRPPEAVVCHSDMIAIGVLKALNDAGIPPAECRVVGIDGIRLASMTTPGLTTVSVHAPSLGRLAGELLLHGTGDDETVRSLVPQLVVRESCGCRT